MSLKLRFTLICAASLRASGVLSTPTCEKMQSALQRQELGVAVEEPSGPLANGLEEQSGCGCGDVQGIDLAKLRQGD